MSTELLTILTAVGLFTLVISFSIVIIHSKLYFIEPVNNIINYFWSVAFMYLFIASINFVLMIILRNELALFHTYLFLLFYVYAFNTLIIISLKTSYFFNDKRPRLHKSVRLLIKLFYIIFIIVLSYYIMVDNNCLNYRESLFFVRFNDFYMNLYINLYFLSIILLIFLTFPSKLYITGIFFKISFGFILISELLRLLDLFINILPIKVVSLVAVTVGLIALQFAVILEYKKDIIAIQLKRKRNRRKEDKQNAI